MVADSTRKIGNYACFGSHLAVKLTPCRSMTHSAVMFGLIHPSRLQATKMWVIFVALLALPTWAEAAGLRHLVDSSPHPQGDGDTKDPNAVKDPKKPSPCL